MRDPLFVPACLFAAGVAFAATGWVTGPQAFGIGLPALALALSGRLLGFGWVFRVCGAMAAFFLGTANMATRPASAPPDSAAPGRQLLAGCVVESAEPEQGRIRLTIWSETAGGVQVNAPEAAGRVQSGDFVRGEVELRPVRNAGMEGAFDREAFWARRGVYWQAVMGAKGRWERGGGRCGNALARAVQAARRTARQRCSALFGEKKDQEALLRGLLLGDGSALHRAWVEDFRRTGTYHALVISGGHITMICGVFLLWRRWFGWGARTAILLSAGLAWLYSLIAGGATPALRAAAAMSLTAAGLLLYRRPRLLNILAATALIFLIADPGQLFEASFQLSFLAVAAIGLLARAGDSSERWESGLPSSGQVETKLAARTLALAVGAGPGFWEAVLGRWFGALRWAGQTILVSAAIQLGLLLPMAVYFHRVSLTGLLANIAVTPAVSLAIPIGFAALAANSHGLGAAAAWLVEIARRMAAWFAGWEPDLPVPTPPAWLAAAFALALVVAAVLARRHRKWALAVLAAALAGAALIIAHPFPPRQTAGELELTMLDTGQSESILIGLPHGGFVLVDAGGSPGRPVAARRFDVGEDVIAPYLRQRGIKRLEEIVITHLHEDHAGGAPALIRGFRPARFRTSYTARDYAGWRRLERELRRAGTQIATAGEGISWDWGPVGVLALAPSPEQRWRGKPSNNDSLVLLLTYGRRRILLTGDAERGVGDRLAEEGLLPPTDVLKLPHHGAKSALSARLLDATRPAIALISAGWKNSFGFPHPLTLAALAERRVIPLRTDLHGAVTVRTDGRWLSYESYSTSVSR